MGIYQGYHQTPEHKLRIGLSNKGKSRNVGHFVSEETRKKISNSLMGNPKLATRKGKKMPEEIKQKLRLINLGRRHTLETIKKLSGKNNHSWKGGITPQLQNRLSQDSWKRIAEKVRKRDNYACVRCGLEQEKRKHDVHHIMPYRLSQNNRYYNLITLCNVCHKKVELGGF